MRMGQRKREMVKEMNRHARRKRGIGMRNGDVPMNRIILPNAPALANTPLFTSGNAKLALSLAITISLPLSLSPLKCSFPRAYQLTTISIPPPNINTPRETKWGLDIWDGERCDEIDTKCVTIDGGDDRLESLSL
jgi:hypothetical protein